MRNKEAREIRKMEQEMNTQEEGEKGERKREGGKWREEEEVEMLSQEETEERARDEYKKGGREGEK